MSLAFAFLLAATTPAPSPVVHHLLLRHGAPPPVAASARPGVDASALDHVLHAFVHQGVVDYAKVARPKVREALHGYLDAVGKAKLAAEGPKAYQLAALINAYNACAIEGVLLGDVPDTEAGRKRLFQVDRFLVYGERTTLDGLRKRMAAFKEPKLALALFAAGQGMPRLRSEAYAGDRLAAQLADQGKARRP